MKILSVLALLCLAAAPAGAAGRPARPAPRPFLDLDFEAPECSSGWKHGEAGDYDLRIDGSEASSGRQSMVARYSGRSAWALPSHALVARDFPAEAQEVLFGAQLVGNGTAWFDGFSLEAEGQPWADGKPNLAPPSRQAISWLRKQAIPFATTEPGGGTADLRKLEPLIGNARVVSLGEQTHGTREFFQMKRRLIELLAGEMGFTLFALEANMPEAEQINQYLRTRSGSTRRARRGCCRSSEPSSPPARVVVLLAGAPSFSAAPPPFRAF